MRRLRHDRFATSRKGLTAALVLSLAFVARAQQGDTLRVLFIGNSYTYTNELPNMVAGMARSASRALFVDESSVGGFTLEQHLNYQPTIDKIHERKWDVVVLQEQSVLPTIPYLRDHSMYPAARKLDSIIRSVGARTMFFLTWGRKTGGEQVYGYYASPAFRDYFEMQDSLTAAYGRIARELSANVCPVGLAWKLEFRANPKRAVVGIGRESSHR